MGVFQYREAYEMRQDGASQWFDMELLRLSHLRDRASEKGHRKELRECVERLQLLSSPFERERQLLAPVQITSDPRMDPDYKSDNDGRSMHETQGTDNGSGRRRSENNSLPVKLHKQVDNGGWPKFVSNSGAHAQGNQKGFEKDHGGHVSEKPGVGWGPIPCDDKSGAFKVGRKDGAGKYVLCLNSNCEDDGLGGKLLDKEMDIERAGSADAKTSDGWVVEVGFKQKDGWEANAGGNRNSGKCPDTDIVVEEWGKPGSFGKGIVCEQETWKQKTVNCERAGRVKKDSGWSGIGDKIKCENGWEVKPVDNRINAGWGSSNNNNDGWESMEGGWGGNTGGNSKEDGWGCNAVGNSKEDGWGGNSYTGGNSQHGDWGGKVGGSCKDDGWEGNAGAYGKDDDAEGKTGAHRRDGGSGGNPSACKRDGGWKGKMRFHSQNDVWGGNPSACKRDGGWKGNTRSPSKYDGWGGKGVTHKKDDDGWEGGGCAQSNDDGWGDDAGIECRNGGWGHCAGSSEKDPERGFGSERGTGFGWGKVGGSRRDHDWGDNAKGMERISGGNRSDGREGFTRFSHRDNEALEITSGRASFLPPHGRGTVHDASTRPGVDGAGANRNNEKEKIWYYQDPSKAVQGPFSMEQLRKWERTKLFPLDLKVWRATEGQDASVLLADALLGRCSNDIPPGFGHHVQNSQGLRCGVPEERKCVPAVTSTRLVQDTGPRRKWDTGNGSVAKECHHGITEGARPWRSLGSDILFSRDSNRDCSMGHWDRGANNRDYSEHHYPHRPGNDNRFSAQKKNFPCKYFARGGCKKGDECDFMH
ncbi:hypothetical protein L7F22_057364 [Adiantum nelumboides]|nr:hypothetical protein [Adiantum nelumboides]